MKKNNCFLFFLFLAVTIIAQNKPQMNIQTHTGIITIDLEDILNITFTTSITEGLIAYYPFNNASIDESGTGNDGTANGGITYVPGKKGQGCNFNGSNAYISIPNSPSLQLSTNKLTIALWFYCTGTPMGSAAFASKNNSITEFPQYTLQLNPLSTINFGIKDTTNNLRWLSKEYPFNLNQWYFIAATWDGDTAKAYVNDSLVTAQPFKFQMKANSLPLALGRDTGGAIDYYQGIMDEIRIYNRALNYDELITLYQD